MRPVAEPGYWGPCASVKEAVEEQQALPIPRCGTRHVCIRGEDGRPLIDLAEYLSTFLPPRESRNRQMACAGCCRELTGFLSGSFTFGPAWGEGSCVCGWPTRMYHTLSGVEGVVTLPLQWHPDEISFPDDDPLANGRRSRPDKG